MMIKEKLSGKLIISLVIILVVNILLCVIAVADKTPESAFVKAPECSLQYENNNLLISWKAVENADGYELEICTNKHFFLTQKKFETSETQFTPSVKNIQKYRYIRIRAYKQNKSERDHSKWTMLTQD